MKIFVYLTALLLAFKIVNAEDKQDHPKATSFYMISSERDYIGQGKAYAYLEREKTQFQVQRSGRGGESSKPEVIKIEVGEKDSWQHWHLAFTSPEHQVLQPGVYKMAERYPFNDNMPGLSISGHGRGCNTLIGEFEILEVKRLENGEIESFAANFIQRCEKSMPPLFGIIRYNSIVPVEARFSEYFAKTTDFTVYLTKYNPITGEKSQPILISKDADSNCENWLMGERG